MKISCQKSARLALLFTGAAACAIGAHEASVSFASARAAAMLADAGAAADKVRVDPFTGGVTVEGLRAGGLSVGRLAFSAPGIIALPGFTAPAFALDGSAVAENVVIDAGYMKYVAKRIEAAGTSLSNGDLAAILDPNSAAPMVERLERLTAASITIPEITGGTELAGMVQKITYRDIRMVNVTKGNIGALSSAGGTVEANDPKGISMTGSYGTITGKNIDMTGIARIMSVARTDDAEPLKVLYENMTIDNYVIKVDPQIEIEIGTMAISNIKGRATKTPLMSLLPVFTDKAAMANPTPELGVKLGLFAVDMLGSLDFGQMEVRDISVKLPPDASVKVFKINRFGMSGFAQGRLGEYVIEGVNFDAKDGSMKMAQFALRGFNFKNILDSMQAALADGPKGIEMIDPKTLIPSLEQIVFSGIDMDVPDKTNKGNSANGARIKLSLGKAEYNASNFLKGIPTTASLGFEHFIMDIAGSKDPNFKDVLAMGYKQLDVSSRLDLAWNEAAQTLALRQWSGGVTGMGAIALKGTFGNVTKDLFSADQNLTTAALLGTVIKDADLKIENTGIFEKALAVQAKEQKKPADQLRKELIAAASVMLPAMLDNAPAAKTLGNALAKFAAQPKTLHITAKAPAGLGLSDMANISNPAEILKKMDVTATADE